MTDLATLLATLPLGYAMALTALVAFLLAFGLAGWLAARRQRAEAARHEAALVDLRVRLAEREKQLDDAKQRLGEVQVSEARLATMLEQKQQHFEAQLALLRDSRDQLRQEFENLANEILERKGRAFSELSQQRISGLLQPIQAEMKGFREKVESIHRHDTEQRAGLRAELRHLQALNREITDQAERLTQALQGQKKVQGNWGELMLENVLEGSGLRPGKDYQREVSFATAEGRRRPDAVVYLPQGRHLVIDAKTSLAAYVRYVNAEDEGREGRPWPPMPRRWASVSPSWPTSTITTCRASIRRMW